jgi:hypothetical protein
MTTPGDRTLERIAALLAQAENAGTEAEAATFMEKAQQLATLRGIDLARARSHTKSKESSTPIQKTVTIGEAGKHGLSTFTNLFLEIARANDITCNISQKHTRVYCYGFAEDIETTEILYASLVVQMVDACEKFLATGEYKNEIIERRVYKKYDKDDWRWDYYGPKGYYEWVSQPTPKTTARINFQESYGDRIGFRLSQAKFQVIKEAKDREAFRAANPHLDEDGNLTQEFLDWFAEDNHYEWGTDENWDKHLLEMLESNPETNDWTRSKINRFKDIREKQDDEPGTALVLANKAEELASFYSKNSNARGSYRGTRTTYSSSSRSAGSSAANSARLSGTRSLPGARKGLH